MTDISLHSIVEYGMATANNHDQLLDFVNEGLMNGFQPYGAPFVTTVQYDNLFIHQAMVRYELKKKNS
jgi:hypothetical protein